MKLNYFISKLVRSDSLKPTEETWNFVHPGTDKVVYDFTDASVPPAYHRSFRAEINGNGIVLSVNCYGNVLNQTTLSTSRERFCDLLKQIDSIKLKEQSNEDSQGLSGGTTHLLELFEKEEKYFSGSVYGNSLIETLQFGNIKGDIAGLHKVICHFIPHFEEEMKRKL